MSEAEESLRDFLEQEDPIAEWMPSELEIEALEEARRTQSPFDKYATTADGWHVTNTETAIWAMRKIQERRAQSSEIERVYQRNLAQLDDWREQEEARLLRGIKYFEGRLTDYHRGVFEEDPTQKTIRLPNGKLTARKLPDRVEVAEGAELTLPQQFQNVKITPKKTDLLKHIKTTGEVFSGVTLVAGETKFSVNVAGADE